MAIDKFIDKLRLYRDTDPLKFFGSIGFLFVALGLLMGLWLIFLFITTGKVGHIPATILTVLLFTSGIQILVFAFLADMWGTKK